MMEQYICYSRRFRVTTNVTKISEVHVEHGGRAGCKGWMRCGWLGAADDEEYKTFVHPHFCGEKLGLVRLMQCGSRWVACEHLSVAFA